MTRGYRLTAANKTIRLFVIGLSLLAVFWSVAIGNAADSNSLGITPRRDYTIQPGGTASDTLFIENLSSSDPLNVAVRAIDFTSKDQSGTPKLLVDPNSAQTAWSLKPYITVPTSIVIPPSKSVYIPVKIHLPSNIGAGSYYSAVYYSATVGPQQQNVTVAASGATLLFVTVPGKANEQLSLKQFGAYTPPANTISNGSFSNWYFSAPPRELAYVIQNNGNVAEQPNGSIIIKDWNGHQVKDITQANPSNNLVLLGQSRLITTCISTGQQTVTGSNGASYTEPVCQDPHLRAGRYTAQMTLLYGINGNTSQQITASVTFWYVPGWFIALLIVVLVILIGVIWWLVVKIKHHRNKHYHHARKHL